MQTIRPSRNQLFCKPVGAETQTKSGFFIPETAAEKPKVGEVINVGGDVKEYKSGDQIIYKSYSTTELELNREKFFLVAEEDVLGAVVESEVA